MKTKRMMSIICFVIASTFGLISNATEFTYDGIIYEIMYNHEVRTKFGIQGAPSISFQDVSGDIEIPETVYYEGDAYTVVQIEIASFANCQNLTSIRLPNTIREIGSQAFRGCSNLKSIEFPKGLSYIGQYAFDGCEQLTQADLSETNLQILFTCTFQNCKTLEYVKLPSSLISIQSSCFRGCESVKNIEIPNEVQSIGQYSFYGCFAIEEINLSEKLSSIGNNTFSYCKSLKTIDIPSGISKIPANCFSSCESLESVKLSENITIIEDAAFRWCNNLTTIELPAQLTTIGDNTFGGCSSLQTIELPAQLITIGDYAFFSCGSLQAIELPAQLTTIGKQAFGGCSSLQTITLPAQLTTIGEYAFSGCSSLQTFELPEKLTTLDPGAFNNCLDLKQVIFRGSVSNVGDEAFRNCKIAKAAYPAEMQNPFDNSVKVVAYPSDALIEDGYIYNGDKSEIYFSPYDVEGDYIVGDNIKVIGTNAFANCKSLKNVIFPESLQQIDAGCFAGCELDKVICQNATPATMSQDAFDTNTYNTANLVIPEGSFNNYHNAGYWKNFIRVSFSGKDEILAHSLTISPTNINTNTGKEIQLSAKLQPAEASQVLSWKTSDETVATVDQSGKVSVIGKGDATINVETTDGSNLSATCKITAVQLVESISLSETSIIMKAGTFVELKATVLPETASDASLTWTSSDPTVARVENGLVLALGKGSAVITVTANDGSDKYARCYVTVLTSVTEIILSKNEINLHVGEFTFIKATVMPDNATYKNLMWKSSDDTVVSIYGSYDDDKLLLLANSVGDALITASATDGSEVTASCNIQVSAKVESKETVELHITINDLLTSNYNVIKAEPVNLKLTPTSDWKVGSLTLNGDDILSDLNVETGEIAISEILSDSEIEASLEYNGPEMDVDQNSGETGIASVPGTAIKVYRDDDKLIVEGVKTDDRITVYNISGVVIKDIIVEGGANTVKVGMAQGQVYIVCVNGYGQKIGF